MRKAIKEKILQQKKDSQFYVKMICEGQSSLSREVFGSLFLQYMCAKFLLEPEEITTDNFYEICQISAEKAAKRPHGELDAAEAASKCGGATTAMNKKILFLLAVNREYGINVTAEDSVQIDTFTQLCDCIYQKLEEQQI
ncbi:hypothetical protein [uncultured Eubacterium sp.]|uniref:hypothetical protein n=1 Tax=uncultured Eubacterium sp. TaxID=165185 RepID=UPI00259743D0|nr:hypothetical protein [uncultured Eubacterium sp.]